MRYITRFFLVQINALKFLSPFSIPFFLVDFTMHLKAYTFAQVMAVTRINICKNGMMSLSRSVLIMYYTSVFIYFWIFSTPVVSLIFGSYLYVCINWFHIHFDEAFSSLRIANYKSFTRFHIKKDGDLEIFTLAVDKVTDQLASSVLVCLARSVSLLYLSVDFSSDMGSTMSICLLLCCEQTQVPKGWKLDPRWESEVRGPHELSHERKHPSKWRSASSPDPVRSVRVVDHFTIERTRTPDLEPSC